ncbi:MAG: chromosomal replication initiator protein DnaA [Oscillospiraceae bacterium]|nr:chromosomal replication initiator protein DnaA [Oscillospiraceae bacterium]
MDSFSEIFALAKEYCRGELSEVAYGLWIKDIEPLSMDGTVATLYVRSEFKKNIIQEKYLDLLGRAMENVLGFPVEIRFQWDSPEAAEPEQPVVEVPVSDGSYEYTFDNFIVGPSNKFAHAAALAVATHPTSRQYNPLLIYGGSGLGKTHLLTAIRTEIARANPNARIIYVRSEVITNELIAAISSKTTDAFHEKYRSADVLLVDDIQFIGGKESTQEEFFHTFNALYQDNKQIVLTSDRPPKEIKTLEDRLRSRFESGIMADIQPPDFETRIAIIRRKAQLLDLQIPDDVAEYIANRLKSNIRQLEGVVKKLNAYKQLAGTNPTILVAQNSIRDILSDNQPIPITVERIINEVARTYGVTAADIRSQKRAAQISNARQVAMHVVREITQMSMSAVGEEFGGRDHSTVVYTLKKVEQEMQRDSHYKEIVEDIINNIREN